MSEVLGLIFVTPRSKTFTLKKPKALSKEQRSVFQAPDLSGMLQRLNGKEC